MRLLVAAAEISQGKAVSAYVGHPIQLLGRGETRSSEQGVVLDGEIVGESAR